MAIAAGVASLPLHPGKAPRWLFQRMVRLGGLVVEAIVLESSPEEFLKRISDPFFFQALGCVLGFDWNSSGLTTTVTGALKLGVDMQGTGIAVCGGKGRASRKTPAEIQEKGLAFSLSSARVEGLARSSRLSAKVDNCAVQDGYGLYHHCFIFTEKGEFAVVQQGMNPESRYARRYHWVSEGLRSFVEEPHRAICCDRKEGVVLDMTSGESKEARKASVDLVKERPERILRYFRGVGGQSSLLDFSGAGPAPVRGFFMPERHLIIDMQRINEETLRKAYEIQPNDYEELLLVPGMGAKNVRALALVSDLVYGTPASWMDPVKFSFSHGGKDGIPYPVDRETYDQSIEVLGSAVGNARIGKGEQVKALRRLSGFY